MNKNRFYRIGSVSEKCVSLKRPFLAVQQGPDFISLNDMTANSANLQLPSMAKRLTTKNCLANKNDSRLRITTTTRNHNSDFCPKNEENFCSIHFLIIEENH